MHAGAQPNTGPTIALIDQRLSALRAGDAGPATAETIQNYDSARESFVRAESFAQTASDYIETLTTAPAEEALIRERLDRLGASPDVR